MRIAMSILVAACGGSGSGSTDANEPDAPSASVGCAAASMLPPGQAVARTITVGGRTRTYRVRLPSTYAGQPTPVVFALHGGFGSGEQIETSQAGFDPIADREGFAMIYPDGIPRDETATGPLAQARTWNGGTCCGPAFEQNVDDVGFLTAVLDEVEADACIDLDRVFSTGMSNGAIMSYRFACERADRIAAIAPVAGSMLFPACAPSRQVPLFHVHGTLDGNVPYDGGTGCGVGMVVTAPIPEVVASWAVRNECAGPPSTVFTEGNGTCVSSGGCAAETVLCSIDGGNHSWPGGEGNNGAGACGTGTVSATFHASEAIWSFFRAHPRY